MTVRSHAQVIRSVRRHDRVFPDRQDENLLILPGAYPALI